MRIHKNKILVLEAQVLSAKLITQNFKEPLKYFKIVFI